MRVDHQPVFTPECTDRRQPIGMGALAGDKAKLRQARHERSTVEIKTAASINRGPQFAHRGGVAADQVEDEAFEVRGLGNIHRRARGHPGIRGAARPVDAGAEKFVEHVILVGGENQPADRQAHHPRDMTGADVAEVPRGHGERHLFRVIFGRREIAFEVIDNLGKDTRPVDRVDRANLVLCLEGGVVGDGLDDVLAVVEHAFDGDVENVRVGQRIHLRALEG